MEIEIISESEIVFTKRGRKATFDQNVADAIAKGNAFRLPSLAVNTTLETYKVDKARISAQIRAAGTAVNRKVKVVWSPADKNGSSVPQVMPAKVTKK
jgi:hypothetical protein